MTMFSVEADVGTVYATIEADSADEAMVYAIQEWVEDAADIFTAATFHDVVQDGAAIHD